MDVTLLNDVAQVQQELRLVRLTLETLQTRVNVLAAQLQEQAKLENRPVKFTDLEGLWAGDDFSLEMIQTAEYRVDKHLA
jgi:hypothetical protein